MIAELVAQNRSYRRFFQDVPVSIQDLRDMIDVARLTNSGRNAQSLRYILSNTEEMNAKIFPALKWAAGLKDWDGPQEGERPSAYVVILNDTYISTNYLCDHGIVSFAILLRAVEKGYGGCIIASADGAYLRKTLNIPEQYSFVHVIALGKPKETIVVEPMPADGNFQYWRDKQGIHHVPKRSLDELIVKF